MTITDHDFQPVEDQEVPQHHHRTGRTTHHPSRSARAHRGQHPAGRVLRGKPPGDHHSPADRGARFDRALGRAIRLPLTTRSDLLLRLTGDHHRDQHHGDLPDRRLRPTPRRLGSDAAATAHAGQLTQGVGRWPFHTCRCMARSVANTAGPGGVSISSASTETLRTTPTCTVRRDPHSNLSAVTRRHSSRCWEITADQCRLTRVGESCPKPGSNQ